MPDDAPADPVEEPSAPDFRAHLAEAERLERNLQRLGHHERGARRAAIPGRRRSVGIRRALMGAVAASLILAIGAGALYPAEVVRMAPGAGRLYAVFGLEVNPSGMEFANVAVSRKIEDGTEVLAVSGEIVNLTGRTLDVPPVRFVLRDAGRHEIHFWTVPAQSRTIAPDAHVRFSTRLATPPRSAADVLIRFADTPERLASRG